MREPDVALTDFALAVEAAALSQLLRWGPASRSPLTRAFRTLFASVGFAAASGGVVHGYCPEEESVGHRLLWPLTLVSAGCGSTAALRIAIQLLGRSEDRGLVRLVQAQSALSVAPVLLGFRRFSLVLLGYVPATVLLSGAFARCAVEGGRRAGGLGLGAMALIGAAALVHRKRITPHPRYLTPDAAAHLLMGGALACLFLSARELQQGEPTADA
jgi:Family of unknown function (DUF6962)